MTAVICHFDLKKLPKASPGIIPVQLYAPSTTRQNTGVIGAGVLHEVRRLGRPVQQAAFDFLSVALAVTAADTFVLRDNAADAWSREIELTVSVANAVRFQPIVSVLEKALNFLSGDVWHLTIVAEGRSSPVPQTRGTLINMRRPDCACLFSGGLDSAIGVLDLLKGNRKPILVSHSYTSDQAKQNEIHQMLPGLPEHFAANAHPTGLSNHDVSMRSRSINFIAYGAVVAATLASQGIAKPVELYVPENGVISLNAPLTPRRIGSLSTRTTHPYYIALIQEILDHLAIPVKLTNPYSFKTKGEMMQECLDGSTLETIVDRTVSCGKWKRKNQQCGRCYPCLIRRAAFHASGLEDGTSYQFEDLADALSNVDDRDDLLAVMLAIKKSESANIAQWISLSGPLPTPPAIRKAHADTFARGLDELETYFAAAGLI